MHQNKNIHFTERIHLRMIAYGESRGIEVENGEEKEYINEWLREGLVHPVANGVPSIKE